MKIRDYAKSVGFEVVGKITYLGKRNRDTRVYIDEAKNEYWLDEVLGTICIVTADGGVI